MTPQHARKVLGGYATGTLTKSEREALMCAALEDADLFEQLVEEEDWRRVFADEEYRNRLRRRLRQLQPDTRAGWRLGTGIFQKRWLMVAGAFATVVVIALIRQGLMPESSLVARVVLGPGEIPALRAAGILEQPGQSERELESRSRTAPPPVGSGATLGLDRAGWQPQYRVGDRQRIGFRLPQDGKVLLVEERADGSVVRLFPNRFQSSPGVKRNETVLVPPAGQGDLTVEGRVGVRRLRLLIFPDYVDPVIPNVNWAQIRNHARVVEKRYEVLP
jgi:hypothetical protein